MKLLKILGNILKEVFQWVQAVVFAVILALLIRGFVFEPVIVQGESMENTLFTGQKLLVFKTGYYFHPPRAGDIVVLQYQSGIVENIPFLNKWNFAKKVFPAIKEIDYIKRVIGVPGDRIDIKDGFVFINGEKKEELYIKGTTNPRSMEFPCTVPQKTVFVMGDNRENSRDSRDIGFIEYDRIKGRALLRIWPLKKFGVIR